MTTKRFDILWKCSEAFADQKPLPDGSTLIAASDGFHFSKDAIQIFIRMAAANGVRRLWIGENGLLSTPASSVVIREKIGPDGVKATCAFIFKACHNPDGPCEDFGVKLLMENGGPPADIFLDVIFDRSKSLLYYAIAYQQLDVDLSKLGVTTFKGPIEEFEVEIISSTDDYLKLTKSIFVFRLIKQLISSPNYDGLNGVSGVYAKRIFIEELGADESSLLNCDPMEDFGGCPSNLNLTYTKELAARMGLGKLCELNPPEFGAAVDADGDNYIIFGKNFFVKPSDSIAIIAANAKWAIPYFAAGLKGFARTITTSAALNEVAKELHVICHEVQNDQPKHTADLMDAEACSIYGEENFSIGSVNIREKDGMWGVLAWLSILALEKQVYT
ncbi:hypothetical protein LUZ63_005932 [Rhynchospora breviuscula]|uniref:Phosphoglucomutase n=1 Tax=Rhynchospora breviuscula TaxID=2022672 RepID=A0A9Q0CNY4_9POAL|nr:hypothetical protein LUZ63_005932 [Rhynchospora breviuscula]